MTSTPAAMSPSGAIVTGGASGIGLATIEALLEHKDQFFIVMADRDKVKGAKEATRLLKDDPAMTCNGVKFVEVDVSREEAIVSLVQTSKTWLAEHNAPLRYLINVAGCDFVQTVGDPEAEQPGKLFDRAVAVNLRSVYLMCHHCVPLLAQSAAAPPAVSSRSQEMLERPHKRQRADPLPIASSIVNISSIQATRSFDGFAAYAATKGGINSITTNLAGTLGRQTIRVNSVCPGAVQTNLSGNSSRFEGQPTEDDANATLDTAELLKGQDAAVVGEAVVGLLLMRGV